jgi:hypothetical protein
MSRIVDNSDRDFLADPIEERDAETLRQLLKRNEVADMFDDTILHRIGEVIGRAALKRSGYFNWNK